jgi:hypothetical protein
MLQLFTTFEHSDYLELAIGELERMGIKKENIFAVPLNNRKVERKIFDSLHNADGISLISTGAVLGTAFSVVGASVGFKLKWGPIYWGLIGVIGGFLLGFLIDLFIYKVLKKKQRLLRGKNSEVILIVDCEDHQGDAVESILWDHFALGIARVLS